MNDPTSIDELARRARAAAQTGRIDEAEALWEQVRARDPRNAQALASLGIHAMHRGDLDRALALLEDACRATPQDLFVRLSLAALRRQRGEHAAELEVLNAALTLDPYFLPGVLAKASWFERNGSRDNAAMHYRAALKIAPPPTAWPAALRPQLEHAKRVSDEYGDALASRLSEDLVGAISSLPPALAGRWREAVSIRAGKSEPYPSLGSQLYVPRLPAVPFFEREQFPWAGALEAKTDVIRAELIELLRSGGEGFAPYISYKPGEPMNQWAELNKSTRWNAFQLYKHGRRVEENCARCPETVKALEAVDLADIDGFCPNVMFSVLAPKTRIPPHTGETNSRVVAHLPLIVPPQCSYRVGFEWREWREGELLIFDDTIEHEARNDSDELRVVLILDLWNPFLSLEEREIVRRMTAAVGAFNRSL